MEFHFLKRNIKRIGYILLNPFLPVAIVTITITALVQQGLRIDYLKNLNKEISQELKDKEASLLESKEFSKSLVIENRRLKWKNLIPSSSFHISYLKKGELISLNIPNNPKVKKQLEHSIYEFFYLQDTENLEVRLVESDGKTSLFYYDEFSTIGSEEYVLYLLSLRDEY